MRRAAHVLACSVLLGGAAFTPVNAAMVYLQRSEHQYMLSSPAKVRAEVLKALELMWQGYHKKDPAQVLAWCIPDGDLLLLGSGADEVYSGPKKAAKGFKRDFSQADEITVKMIKPAVSSAGKTAWVVCGLRFVGKAGKVKLDMRGRFTAILEKRRGKWLLAHSHFSMPYGSQNKGQSYSK